MVLELRPVEAPTQTKIENYRQRYQRIVAVVAVLAAVEGRR
jgi:hypothetical protein